MLSIGWRGDMKCAIFNSAADTVEDETGATMPPAATAKPKAIKVRGLKNLIIAMPPKASTDSIVCKFNCLPSKQYHYSIFSFPW